MNKNLTIDEYLLKYKEDEKHLRFISSTKSHILSYMIYTEENWYPNFDGNYFYLCLSKIKIEKSDYYPYSHTQYSVHADGNDDFGMSIFYNDKYWKKNLNNAKNIFNKIVQLDRITKKQMRDMGFSNE